MKASTPAPETREVRIPCGQAWLYGDLALPTGFTGLVLFVHGSGSGRHSARNRQVAQKLQQSGIATLQHRFDIALLTERKAAYPKAGQLLITADCGGSNGYRVRLWRRAPMATPNCSTYGHPNCPRQDGRIISFLA